jgi:hypothetical protein
MGTYMGEVISLDDFKNKQTTPTEEPTPTPAPVEEKSTEMTEEERNAWLEEMKKQNELKKKKLEEQRKLDNRKVKRSYRLPNKD